MLTSCSHTVAVLVWVIQDYCESGGLMINSYHLTSLIVI